MSDPITAPLRRWRHELHRMAEVGFAEHDTAAYVADQLRALGYEPTTGVGGTGVVASLPRGTGRQTIGLRADMDALAITEQNVVDHASRNPGAMHACGHDGHMTMLLGAAAALAAGEVDFDGTVRFVFQPAEEHGRGARAMLDDGLLDRFPMDAIYGLHNMPGFPVGHLFTRPGAVMAAEDNFEIRIVGRGGHAARPHMVIDPIVIAAEIITALQTIVARTLDPSRSAVVSCTEIVTDGARNAIPTEVVIRGDTRSFHDDDSARIEARMRELCRGIGDAYGAVCTVTYTKEFAPTTNDAACADLAVRAARAAVGAERVDADCDPILASEDFGVFAAAIPGCFTFIGNGVDLDAGGTPLHSARYDFNDDVAPAGVRFYVELVGLALAPA